MKAEALKAPAIVRRVLGAAVLVVSLAACGGSQVPIAPLRTRTDYSQSHDSSSGSNYRVLFSFGKYTKYYGDDPRGADPAGGLIDVSGTLYGTTWGGGQNYSGTVFRIARGGKQRNIYNFEGIKTGENPMGTLVAVNGKLYGTASGGGDYQGDGTIFGIDPTGQDFHVLHEFAGGSYDGSQPLAGLVSVRGWLYGTTYRGGANDAGTIFGLKLSGDGTKILHSFAGGSDGCGPMAALLYSRGKLYGTTAGCGTGKWGTVFSLDLNTSKEKVLYSFAGGSSDGAGPAAGVVMQDGTLYGTTEGGGPYNYGTVFSLTTAGSEDVLHSFGSSGDGIYPKATLTVGPGGMLYGTTYIGGGIGWGTLFSISPNGEESILHNFGFLPDGEFPEAQLLYLGHQLYGTTYYGGRHGHHCLQSQYCDYGTVFKMNI